jgi:hypothetical protein
MAANTGAYPVATGVTSMSGVYIPTVWTGKTLIKFYLTTVFGSIANTDYEGEIKNHGDTVEIRTIPDITIRDYEIDQNLVYERPTGTVVELSINKGKYYAISVNDVEKKQADIPYVEKWTDDAGEQMAIKIDNTILNAIYSDVHASNTGATAGVKSSAFNLGITGTQISLDKTNILDYIVDCGTVLDEQDVPQMGRWFVITPLFAGMIKKSDLKDASLAGDGTSILRNGRIGMIDRFTLYSSNNYTAVSDTTSTWHLLFGHPRALTFASQLVQNEIIPNPNDFGQLMRGLQVFGYKVVKSEAIGDLYADKA